MTEMQHNANEGVCIHRSSVLRFLSYVLPAMKEMQTSCTIDGGDHSVSKKLSHNANERYRRKRMNNLYSALRSLLPNADQTKRLSVPATVSRALKYIPELQKQVESLMQKRKEILNGISREKNEIVSKNNAIDPLLASPTVLVTLIHESELLVQVSTTRHRQGYLLSEVVRKLEDDGLQILTACAFGSGEDRVFYTIHLQMEEKNTKINSEAIRQKLLLLDRQRG